MIFGQYYNIKLIISFLNSDSYDKVDKQALKILRLEKQLQMVQKDIMQKDYAGKVLDLTDELGEMKEKLRKYEELFTPGQRKRIVTGKATHWTEEDKSVAMATYCAGPKAYKLLRKRGIPLPAPRTLKKYAESYILASNSRYHRRAAGTRRTMQKGRLRSGWKKSRTWIILRKRIS